MGSHKEMVLEADSMGNRRNQSSRRVDWIAQMGMIHQDVTLLIICIKEVKEMPSMKFENPRTWVVYKTWIQSEQSSQGCTKEGQVWRSLWKKTMLSYNSRRRAVLYGQWMKNWLQRMCREAYNCSSERCASVWWVAESALRLVCSGHSTVNSGSGSSDRLVGN